MERYTMFLDWKNQYCENDYITQSHLLIQCNPYQTTSGILHRIRTKKFYNSYGNTKDPEQPKQSWERKTELEESSFPTSNYIQSYSSQDSMVVTQKQKYRSMVQDRKSRDKPTHIWSTNLWQRKQEHTMENRQPLQ